MQANTIKSDFSVKMYQYFKYHNFFFSNFYINKKILQCIWILYQCTVQPAWCFNKFWPRYRVFIFLLFIGLFVRLLLLHLACYGCTLANGVFNYPISSANLLLGIWNRSSTRFVNRSIMYFFLIASRLISSRVRLVQDFQRCNCSLFTLLHFWCRCPASLQIPKIIGHSKIF